MEAKVSRCHNKAHKNANMHSQLFLLETGHRRGIDLDIWSNDQHNPEIETCSMRCWPSELGLHT